MARTATYVIVAEDLAGARFVEAYLDERGVGRRDVRSLVAPRGQGSGKQWVEGQYPREVKLYRSKRNHVYKALLVATDADNLTVARRVEMLAEALRAANESPRAPDEEIVLVVPKWEIETWTIHLLDAVPVSEDEKTGWPAERSERECPKAGRMLRAHRASGATCCPPSMVSSDDEFARLSP